MDQAGTVFKDLSGGVTEVTGSLQVMRIHLPHLAFTQGGVSHAGVESSLAAQPVQYWAWHDDAQ